ncbi:thioesterase, partial [Winslowiella iniecta]
MAIWQREATLEQLNQRSAGCMVGHLGIRFTAINDDSLEA